MSLSATRIFKTTLSIVLAFALVPAVPLAAFAEDGKEASSSQSASHDGSSVAVNDKQTSQERAVQEEQVSSSKASKEESSSLENDVAKTGMDDDGATEPTTGELSSAEKVVVPEGTEIAVSSDGETIAEVKDLAKTAKEMPVGFAYFEAQVTVGQQQTIAVVLDNESFTIKDAVLNLKTPDGSTIELASTDCVDDAALFEMTVQQSGAYRLEYLKGHEEGSSQEFVAELSVDEGEVYAFTGTTTPAQNETLEGDEVSISAQEVTEDGVVTTAPEVEEAIEQAVEEAIETSDNAVSGTSLASALSTTSSSLNSQFSSPVNNQSSAGFNSSANSKLGVRLNSLLNSKLGMSFSSALKVNPSVGIKSVISAKPAVSTSAATNTKSTTGTTAVSTKTTTTKKNLIIALDPGHGGSDSGAVANGLREADLNWAIAVACKNKLEQNMGVTVVLTRGENETVALKERVKRATRAGATVLVSLHNNSAGLGAPGVNGAEVYCPNNSSYRAAQRDEARDLSNRILSKLTALGLQNRGVKYRDSEYYGGSGPYYYPNGQISDFYTIIEESRLAGIAGLIVEHGFITGGTDSVRLSSSSFLRRLGEADAQAIIEKYALVNGWEQDGSYWKLKRTDGTYAVNCWETVGGKKYYFDKNGHAVSGWQTIGGKKYYFDSSCALVANQWYQNKGAWYYYTSSGALATGWQSIDGSRYFFDSQNRMMTGWIQDANKKWYFLNGSGAMQSNRWISSGGAWYWLSSSGAMGTGWLYQSGTWYYLNRDSGAMSTGWAQDVDNKWYYFDGSGAMQSNRWISSGGAWYWLSSSGAMGTGWLYQSGTWYYLNRDSGAMSTGWAQDVDNKWYYFDGSGAMQSNRWISSGGAWYWLTSSGAMKTGWGTIGGVQYYFGSNGAMATGTRTIGSEICKFASSGALLSRTPVPKSVGGSSADSASLIMGSPKTTVNQMVNCYNQRAGSGSYPVAKYQSRGAKNINEFCQILYDEAVAEGVRPEVLFSQVMTETGWLKFGGAVDSNGKVQCNFGGIGATGGAVGGATFPDVRTGLRAQVQHLKAYASKDAVKKPIVDPRFHLVTRGCAPSVYDLAGRWATDTSYGTKLMAGVNSLLKFPR